MLLDYKTTIEGAKIAIWKIEETEQELLSLFENPKTILHQIESTKNNVLRCERLAVRALIKTLTKQEKPITYQANGKPALSDNSFQISISHTKGFAAVILHPTKPVGIDIESISERACRLKSRFMNIKEREAIDNDDEPVVSLLHWSAKETVFKLISQNGIDFSAHIHLSPFKLIDKQINASESFTALEKSFEIHFEITDRYVLTYCIN